MERCECLPLNSKLAWKSVLVKTKSFDRQTVISITQLFKVLSTGTNICPQPWPCRRHSAWTQPRQKLTAADALTNTPPSHQVLFCFSAFYVLSSKNCLLHFIFKPVLCLLFSQRDLVYWLYSSDPAELGSRVPKCYSKTVFLSFLFALLPFLPISEWRRYCVTRRPSVTLSRCVCACVSAALVSAAKVMHCIQCSLITFVLLHVKQNQLAHVCVCIKLY